MIRPHWAGWTWLVLDICAAVATVAIIGRYGGSKTQWPWRFIAAFILFFVFGWIWCNEIGRFEPRQEDAFWPTLFLLGYTLAGLWDDPRITPVEAALAA